MGFLRGRHMQLGYIYHWLALAMLFPPEYSEAEFAMLSRNFKRVYPIFPVIPSPRQSVRDGHEPRSHCRHCRPLHRASVHCNHHLEMLLSTSAA